MNDILNAAAELLSGEYGCRVSAGYYSHIRTWEQWWEGFVPDFHRCVQYGFDGRRIERRLYSLHMAKRICEDWASILLNDRTTISVGDRTSGLFLQGEDGTGGVFGESKFWRRGNELVERAFALGGGAFVLRARNLRADSTGRIVPHSGVGVGIEYLTAMQLLPLSVENGEITEAAFISERIERNERFVYIETHTLENGNYVIKNRYFRMDGGELHERPLPKGVAGTINTGSPRKWFAIVRPNISNNIPGADGRGISVYGNALDVLKGVDLAYNNTNRDVYLGGKKVFYNKAMLQKTADGRYITPDDVIQQLFTQIGDDSNFDVREMAQEFNPSLRAQENRDSVQAQLDYLAFMCGLGTRRYQFGGGTVLRTATEYIGNRQEIVQMAAKHYILVEEALKTLCAGLLYIGREFMGRALEPDTEISVSFENSYIIDKDEERENDKEDVAAGLMSRAEYRVKWYGETAEDAAAWVRANPHLSAVEEEQ